MARDAQGCLRLEYNVHAPELKELFDLIEMPSESCSFRCGDVEHDSDDGETKLENNMPSPRSFVDFDGEDNVSSINTHTKDVHDSAEYGPE